MYRSMYQRKPVSRVLREYVWDMSYGMCWYCGVHLNPYRDFVVEHVVPLCRGGDDDISNLVPACCYCNQSKGTKLLEEWMPIFADEQGQGSNPEEWVFWFQLPRGSLMPGCGVFRGRYTHEQWREVQIKNFLITQDDPDWEGR